MRYISFKYGDKLITNENKINKILIDNDLGWLIDCEFEQADIEIKKKTIIWNSGTFFNGDWRYGIFRSGKFYGRFLNGIFEDGEMRGELISGITE